MQDKILVGHKLRRFRQSVSMSQTAMADALDISPSYLNLLEHNQRPLTVSLLLRLGNAFDIDLKEFAEDDSAALTTELGEVFSDPVLANEPISRREIQDLVTAAPGAARSIANLFQAYRKVRAELEIAAGDGRVGTEANNPVERVRDVLQRANNYFAEMEEAAEDFNLALGKTAIGDGSVDVEHLAAYARSELGLRVRVMPVSVMGTQLRRYDQHRREILISESLRRPQRLFHLLVQFALITQSKAIDSLITAHDLTDATSQSLFRISLASYFAGAVMMPYEPFLNAARELRHDLELLGRRFGASFEQVCHRLTSLNAPSSRGIPFFFIRVDGQKFFTIARTVPRQWSPPDELAPEFAVALGCEMHHARDIVYADRFVQTKGATPPDPIGIGCAVCERMECAQRAHLPIGHEVRFDGHMRRVGLYDLGVK